MHHSNLIFFLLLVLCESDLKCSILLFLSLTLQLLILSEMMILGLCLDQTFPLNKWRVGLNSFLFFFPLKAEYHFQIHTELVSFYVQKGKESTKVNWLINIASHMNMRHVDINSYFLKISKLIICKFSLPIDLIDHE